MKRRYKLALFSIMLTGGLVLSLGACDQRRSETDKHAPGSTMGTTIDDGVLTAKVKSALISEPDIKSFDLQVETRNGVVQLSGFVDNAGQIERAMQVARSVTGVVSVENKMSVKGGTTSVGEKIDDSVITTKIKSELLMDSAMKGADISVVTREGAVQLSGFVNREAQIQRALEIARGTEGVKAVENKMSIKS